MLKKSVCIESKTILSSWVKLGSLSSELSINGEQAASGLLDLIVSPAL